MMNDSRNHCRISLGCPSCACVLLATLAMASIPAAAEVSASADVRFRHGRSARRSLADLGRRASRGEGFHLIRVADGRGNGRCRWSNWISRLQPVKAGGPFTMMINADNEILFDNVVVGDVLAMRRTVQHELQGP